MHLIWQQKWTEKRKKKEIIKFNESTFSFTAVTYIYLPCEIWLQCELMWIFFGMNQFILLSVHLSSRTLDLYFELCGASWWPNNFFSKRLQILNLLNLLELWNRMRERLKNHALHSFVSKKKNSNTKIQIFGYWHTRRCKICWEFVYCW